MISSDLGARFDTLTLSPMPAVRRLSRSLAIAFAVDRWSALSRAIFNVASYASIFGTLQSIRVIG